MSSEWVQDYRDVEKAIKTADDELESLQESLMDEGMSDGDFDIIRKLHKTYENSLNLIQKLEKKLQTFSPKTKNRFSEKIKELQNSIKLYQYYLKVACYPGH